MSEHSDGGGNDDGATDADGSGLTTTEYLRLTVLNRISLVGIGLGVLGAVLVSLTAPAGPLAVDTPLLGGGLLLGGVLVFALGFSLGQRTLGDREDW